jgi:PAS domain S-box-containing protein
VSNSVGIDVTAPKIAAPRRRGSGVTRAARVRLMVLLPATVAVLVAATGFFTLDMASRHYMIHGFGPAIDHALAGLEIQIAAITVAAAILGLGLGLGVTSPRDRGGERPGDAAPHDGRAPVDTGVPGADWLAGAFNDAIGAINRYIFQSMTGAVITLNPEGRVIASSPAAEVVLGHREEELVGKRFSEVFAPADGGDGALAAIEAAIGRREAVSAGGILIAAKDGRPIRIDVSVSYLQPRGGRDRAAGGETIGVLIAFKDLTEIRRLRDRLQQADHLVALGTLTAGVAHELRNPLASLQGLAELLGRDFGGDDPRRRYVATMLDSIARLNRLVEDLLALSAPGSPVEEPFDLNQVVRETVGLARLGLGDKAVAIDCRTAADPAIVIGSAARVGQALTNVVLNAVQATPAGGAITVTAETARGLAAARVHNTGSYVAPEQREKLFAPFYTTKAGGTGLGLAIARQIVTAHGGRLEVESDPAAGTTFVVELPLATGGSA